MIISAYQPYFAPFSGFFAKAIRSDLLIIMDRFSSPGVPPGLQETVLRMTRAPSGWPFRCGKKGLGLQEINEVRICHEGRWARKHLVSLKSAYANAPFFEDHVVFIEKIFSEGFEKLIDLNLKIIEYLMKHLRIPTKVELLSKLQIETGEPRLSVEICRKLGATQFLAQSGAKNISTRRDLKRQVLVSSCSMPAHRSILNYGVSLFLTSRPLISFSTAGLRAMISFQKIRRSPLEGRGYGL